MGLLCQLLRLMCRRDLGLFGLAYQFLSDVEARWVGIEGLVRALDEVACDGVLGIERRQPLLCRFVFLRNLGQLLRQLFERHILMTKDAQHGYGSALGDADLVAQINDFVRKGPHGSRCGGCGEPLYLLRRKPVDNADIAAGAYGRALRARCQLGKSGGNQYPKNKEQQDAVDTNLREVAAGHTATVCHEIRDVDRSFRH